MPNPTAFGAAVRGASHEISGAPGQDAVLWCEHEEVAIVAVADGHGSSPRGDVGANLAVKMAIPILLHFHHRLDAQRRESLPAVSALARDPLRSHLTRVWADAVRGGDPAVSLRDHGSTLLFALATPTWLLFGQLGDGEVLLVEGDEVRRPLPPDPDCLGNQTSSLCQEDAAARMRIAVLPRPEGEALLVLLTDGYVNSYATDEDVDTVAAGYLTLLRQIGAEALAGALPGFLSLVSAEGSGDDVAVAFVHLPLRSTP